MHTNDLTKAATSTKSQYNTIIYHHPSLPTAQGERSCVSTSHPATVSAMKAWMKPGTMSSCDHESAISFSGKQTRETDGVSERAGDVGDDLTRGIGRDPGREAFEDGQDDEVEHQPRVRVGVASCRCRRRRLRRV